MIDPKVAEAKEIDLKSLQYRDCNQTVFMAQASIPRNSSVSEDDSFMIKTAQNVYPWFTIKSKLRIDNIDYVTYILGAMGSWIEFSFIGINPISYSLQKVDTAIGITRESRSNGPDLRGELSRQKQKIFFLEKSLIAGSNERDEMRNHLNQKIKFHDEEFERLYIIIIIPYYSKNC